MTLATFIRISGLVAIMAGILNVLSGLPSLVPERTLALIRRAADICALIGIAGIYLHQRKELGTLGQIGFAVALAAVLMLIFSLRYEMAIGIYALGLFLFAIATLQANIFPRWVAWMWIIAPLIGIPAFLFSNIAQFLFLLAAIAFALGFAGAGYHMLTATTPG